MSFAETIAEFQPLLARVVSSYEYNTALQQELMQEIALCVWQALPRFNAQSSLKTYVLKIAHNRAVTHVATQQRHYSSLSSQDDDMDALEAINSKSPEALSSQQQQLSQLLAAIRSLPVQYKQVVTLSLEGLSYQEISEVTGMNVNQIGVTLNRAKKQLNKAVQDDR